MGTEHNVITFLVFQLTVFQVLYHVYGQTVRHKVKPWLEIPRLLLMFSR